MNSLYHTVSSSKIWLHFWSISRYLNKVCPHSAYPGKTPEQLFSVIQDKTLIYLKEGGMLILEGHTQTTGMFLSPNTVNKNLYFLFHLSAHSVHMTVRM